MATLTVRDLDDSVHRKLRIRAAENGRSMEAEAREILGCAVADPVPIPEYGLGSRIHALFAEVGGVELDIPPRTEMQRDIVFEE